MRTKNQKALEPVFLTGLVAELVHGIRQTPTGIPGLDEILGGGLPAERLTLVSGPAGAGKSTFALQFLYHGALNEDEPGIYVTFDEKPENVRNDMLSYGWDLRGLEKQGLFAMVDGFSSRAGVASKEPYTTELDVDELLTVLVELIDEIGAERVVIDSITAVALSLQDEVAVRKEILKLGAVLSTLTCTTIMTSEMTRKEEVSRFGVEEFMAQGVIVLDYIFAQHGMRTVQVRKMRGIKHSTTERPFKITDRGIIVYPNELIYTQKPR